MARARTHDLDAILDAARAIVLRDGARGASIAAIAAASGAPTGSLYHAFGSRDGLVAALFARAARRSQDAWLAAEADDPVEACVGMARALVAFAAANPEDLELLLAVRPADLGDGALDLDVLNAPIMGAVRRLARRLGGPRATERVRLAALALPYGALRGTPPTPALADDLEAAARAVLATDREGAR